MAEITTPLIGISAYLEQAAQGLWDQRYGMLPETYLAAVEAAGGAPLLLPPQPATPAAVARVLDALDGLILSGGADVDPALYGAARGAHTQEPRTDRDAWERALVLGAIERDLPVLAICRGAQLLNVALGGTLIQHVPDVVGTTRHSPEGSGYGLTDVALEPGSRVDELLGGAADRIRVHCHHHQALDRVADGLTVTARGEDGVVEAVELAGHRFAVGVQWHPEQNREDRRLFQALADAAVAAAPGAGSSADERVARG